MTRFTESEIKESAIPFLEEQNHCYGPNITLDMQAIAMETISKQVEIIADEILKENITPTGSLTMNPHPRRS